MQHQHKGRFIVHALFAYLLFSCASAPVKPGEPRPAGVGQVHVTVTGFEGEEGQALVAVFLDEKGWPDDEASAFRGVVLPIQEGEVVAEFSDVPAGPFAVSVFHDKNSNRVLDTGAFGIPSEDYGFSQNARGVFGPPSFDDARLELTVGESKRITIHIE
jgi:uncharacterized protein (DUF2141 family)